MNLTWYARRLSRMDLAEIAARGRDASIKSLWRRRQVRDIAKDRLAVAQPTAAFSTPLPPIDRGSIPQGSCDRLIRAADELLVGRWRIFDRTREDMADAPDWFLDLCTHRRAPKDRYAFDINHRRVDQVGTVKYVWEASRHHHLTMMATAYWLTGEVKYAELVARHLHSWWVENPFLSGIHWTSGIELGIRLIAWVWIRRMLGDWRGVGELFDDNDVFLRQLFYHQQYLARMPSSGSSANNHIIAEMAGLFVASCAFPCFPNSLVWRERAAARLRHELSKQTFPCGINKELATGYQGLVLELTLAAALEGEAAGRSLGLAYWETIRKMVDALAAIVDARLNPPRQGDDDDGQGLLLDAPDFDRWASLLATGSTLFGECNWWPNVRSSDLRTSIWTCFASAPRLEDDRPDQRLSFFPDAGMVILRHRAGAEDEIWCRCDHGPHGYLSIAAHAHADALSVELRHGGIDILSDPGTYVYQGEVEWRAYFRSTLGHNCLELNGTSQSVPGGPFMWLRSAKSELIKVSGLDNGAVAEWTASHKGYVNQPPGATHVRSVRLDREAARLTIADHLEGGQKGPCRLGFHLGPAVDCQLKGGRAALRWTRDGKEREAVLELPDQLKWKSVRGNCTPPMGWYSPSFGVKDPATSLIGAGTLGANEPLVTVLCFEPICDESTSSSSCAVPA